MITLEFLRTFRQQNLTDILATKDVASIKTFLDDWGLCIKDKTVKPKPEYTDLWKDLFDYYDKKQLVTKISLNSAYGALLNSSSRFFDQRLGQSTTLTGRSVTRHMAAKTNEFIAGEYNYDGSAVVYGDTDSFFPSTNILSNFGEQTIEDLFNGCKEFWNDGDKEYAYDPDLAVMSYDDEIEEPYLGHIEYIYRHKVSKDLYEIEDELGNIITVTEDHSVMVERNGNLISVKPAEIMDDDIIVSVIIGD